MVLYDALDYFAVVCLLVSKQDRTEEAETTIEF